MRDTGWKDGDVVRFPVVGEVSLHTGESPGVVVLRYADGRIALVMQRAVVDFYLESRPNKAKRPGDAQ